MKKILYTIYITIPKKILILMCSDVIVQVTPSLQWIDFITFKIKLIKNYIIFLICENKFGILKKQNTTFLFTLIL